MAHRRKRSSVLPSAQPSVPPSVQAESSANSVRRRNQQTEPEADAQADQQRVQSSAQALPEPDVNHPDGEDHHAQESQHRVESNPISEPTELPTSPDNDAAHSQVDQRQNQPGCAQNLSNAIPAADVEPQPHNDYVAEDVPSPIGTQVNGDQHYYASEVVPPQRARSREASKEAVASKKDEESDSNYHDQDATQQTFVHSKWFMMIVLVIVLLSVSAAIVLACVYGRDSKSWNSMHQSCVLEKEKLAVQLQKKENTCKIRERERENVWKQRQQEKERACEQRELEIKSAWKQREQETEIAHEKIINEWLAREQQWDLERSLVTSANQDRTALSAGVNESRAARSEPEDLLDDVRYRLLDDSKPSVSCSALTGQTSYQVSKTTSSL